MYTSPPQSVLSSAPLTFTNPSQPQSSTPAVNAQIANASSWIVQVQTQYGSVSVQPFTASTLPILEQTVTITPMLQMGTIIAGVSGGTISVSWMIAHEQPPIPDGPLTAAAIIASQQISSIANSQRLIYSQTTPASPFTVTGFLPTDQYVVFSLAPFSGHNDPMIISSVVGQQSGIVYASILPVSNSYYSICPILPSLDTGLVITYVFPGVNGLGTFKVVSSPVRPPDPVLPTQVASAEVVINANFSTAMLGGGANQSIFKLLSGDIEFIPFSGAGTAATVTIQSQLANGTAPNFFRLDSGGIASAIPAALSRSFDGAIAALWSLAGNPRALQLNSAISGAHNGIAACHVTYQQIN